MADKVCYTLPAGSDPVVDTLDEVVDKLQATIDALYDVAAIMNPKMFIFTANSTEKQITPGTAVTIYKNARKVPAILYIRMQMPETSVKGYLYISGDGTGDTTAALAPIMITGEMPEFSVILPPNATLYANCTSPDGTGNPLNLVWSAIPLRGRSAIFTEI